MSPQDWIAEHLPPNNGITSERIAQALTDNGNNRELALADLLEILAGRETHKSVTIGSLSYSDPLLLDRASYWRGQAGTGAGSSFSFVPIKQPTPLYDEFGDGYE